MVIHLHMSFNVRKHKFWNVSPTKTQISQRNRAVWLEYALFAWRNFAPFAIQSAPSDDADQTAQIAQSDLNLRLVHMSNGTFLSLYLV